MLSFIQTHTPWLLGLIAPLSKLLSLWPKAKPHPVIQARDINVTINVQVMKGPDH